MTRYLKGERGQFTGSIGDGRDSTPTPAHLPDVNIPPTTDDLVPLADVRQALTPTVPQRLSPSSANTFRKCPKLFHFTKVLGIRTPGSEATTKGTLSHLVLEDLWSRPAPERTPDLAHQLVDEHWQTLRLQEDVQANLEGDPKFEHEDALLRHVHELIDTYFTLEDVTHDSTVDIPFFGTVNGQELHVQAEVGGGTFQGFIDRLDAVTDPHTGRTLVRVTDYKGLAVTTPLATPNGWTTMGEVQVGDEVFGRNGLPTRVLGKSRVKNLACYRVTFDDGSDIVCDEEHLWEVSHGYGGNAEVLDVVSVKALLEPRNGRSHAVWVDQPKALILPEVVLPIDPYVLGVWLGDGKSASSELFVAADRCAELCAELQACGESVSDSTNPSTDAGLRVLTTTTVRTDVCKRGHARRQPRQRWTGKVTSGDCSRKDCAQSGDPVVYGPLMTRVRHLNLLRNKHVPAVYMRASYEQRLSLLQGLMDTDGSWNSTRAQAVFTNTNARLVDAVAELVHSLGGKTSRYAREYVTGEGRQQTATQVMFTPVGFCPFRMPLRVAKMSQRNLARAGRRYIRSIELVESVPTQCIQVDAPDSMYLAGTQMVPTHNTGKLPSKPAYMDDYWFQQMTYASLLREKYGLTVDRIRLVYLTGQVYEREVTDADIDTHDAELQRVWENVQVSAEHDDWPAKPAFLCHWCYFKDQCPPYQASAFADRHRRMYG